MLLENGILVTFALSKHSGDIERVFIDRTLITRLHANLDNGEIDTLPGEAGEFSQLCS